jgi:hypothetical protein
VKLTIKAQLRGLSPQANYTDRRFSAKFMPTFADKGVLCGQADSLGRNLAFL